MPSPHFLLRPVRKDDLIPVSQMVKTIGGEMTTLPKNPDFLAHRINDSIRAFDPRVQKPGGETYLFVLEDLNEKQIVGTSGILSRVGGFDPFYTYEVRRHVQEYAPLDIRIEMESLHLRKNHKGPTEICSLFLHHDYRLSGLGRLLSLPRFCFMKTFADRFDEEVIAEMRGFIDAKGQSPFWEAVGKQFFEREYYTFDILSGLGEKDFIEALMPRYPIYISLLPEFVRQVIGQVHPNSEPARQILQKEGFRETAEIDIFDAGPILKARLENLRTCKAAKIAISSRGKVDPGSAKLAMLSNQSLDFRALVSRVGLIGDHQLVVSPESLDTLKLDPGDPIMFVPL